ncbi:MAG: hypothetical protein V4467_03550 [Patescibacteria group bacterium]
MNWKHWPYWIKGGIIAGGITALFSIAYYGCVHTSIYAASSGYACLPFIETSPLYPFVSFFDRAYPELSDALSLLIITLCSVVTWSIVGVFFGFLYGKIKNRKSA